MAMRIPRGVLDTTPDPPRKSDCAGCVQAKADDWADRWPVGDCGPTCLRRAYRHGRARVVDGRWVVP